VLIAGGELLEFGKVGRAGELLTKAELSAAKGADDLAKLGRSGKQARLREIATDTPRDELN